ncbi:unnamed protein product, partial [Discosporangium mesarthrocarpum]
FLACLVSTEAAGFSSYIEASFPPDCPAALFFTSSAIASCYQDWEQNGRWFLRVRSTGIPSHPYGKAYKPWTDKVIPQDWDMRIPLTSESSGKNSTGVVSDLETDPQAFLTAASQEGKPLGIALNGVPFFSPMSPSAGIDTINPPLDRSDETAVPFDSCAGSLEAETGAYGYRVMPPCLYGPTEHPLQPQGYEPSLSVLGFTPPDGALPSPLLGFMVDGNPIYGPYNADGLLVGGLDRCNGRRVVNGTYSSSTYAYHTTPQFPYVIGCLGSAGALSADDDGRGEVTSLAATWCPAGSFHSAETGGCKPCPAGTYGNHEGLASEACSGACPRGLYCPAGTATPTLNLLCPAGRFGASEGLGDENCSGVCAPGYFCLDGSVDPRSNECGSEKFYCPAGSPQRLSVENGYYSTVGKEALASTEATALRRVRSGQAICEPGFYCVGGLRKPCPAGTFGGPGVRGLNSSACGAPCPTGSYCPEGSVLPIPCPAGSYGAEYGLTSLECSGLCMEGHYCPAGSTSPTQKKCPAGRYGAVKGLRDQFCVAEEGCAPDGGGYCSLSLCEPGFYCPPGSTIPRQNPCGGPELYCPKGSGWPTPVDSGHYSTGPPTLGDGGSWSAAGEEMTMVRAAQHECEPGHFCVGGRRYPCPAGVYGDCLGATGEGCCGPCPAGRYCPEATASRDGQLCGSPELYCPEGSGAPSIVGEGNYTFGGPADQRVGEAICPRGSYCVKGLRHLCPPGTHGSSEGLSSPSCMGKCPAGHYCPMGTASLFSNSSSGPIPCPPGVWGREGSGNSLCWGECRAGYYCPEGSTSPEQHECGPGARFYCPAGSGSPLNVTEGYYATGVGRRTKTGQGACLEGRTPPAGAGLDGVCP